MAETHPETGQDDAPRSLTEFFEAMYLAANGDPAKLPWATAGRHPGVQLWLDAYPTEDLLRGRGRRAIVVGAGLGHDAVELAHRGYEVTAFDVSPSAVAAARRHHGDEHVHWQVGDLLAPEDSWRRAFDFVLEIFTIQSLPIRLRRSAIQAVADLVAPGGTALVVAVVLPDDATPADREGPPWPLTEEELAWFTQGTGLRTARTARSARTTAADRPAHVLVAAELTRTNGG